MNLHQLSSNYVELKDRIEEMMQDPENDVDLVELLQETLESIEDGLEQKAENIAKLLKNWEADIVALKKEEEYFKRRRTSLENQTKGLKDYVFGVMTQQGMDELKGGHFKFKTQKSNPSVFVSNENAIPAQYREAQPDKIDKKSLLSDLKSGMVIPGAELKAEEKHLRLY